MRHELLVTYRESRGITQIEAARRAGWSQSRMSRIERGAQKLTIDDFNHLAGVLDLSWSERIALIEAPPSEAAPAA